MVWQSDPRSPRRERFGFGDVFERYIETGDDFRCFRVRRPFSKPERNAGILSVAETRTVRVQARTSSELPVV